MRDFPLTKHPWACIIETQSLKKKTAGREALALKDYSAGKPWKMEKQQHILETAYRLFSEKGIPPVSMPDVAKACGVGRATVFRYFSTKLELVVAIAIWKWTDYIEAYQAAVTRADLMRMTGAENLDFFLGSFLDLYRNHPDILRFNYDFNSYLCHEADASVAKQPYERMVERLGKNFHVIYRRGVRDGSLNASIPEQDMFSASFHIMLAAVTRYATGLVVVPKGGVDLEGELVMLKTLLLQRFTRREVSKGQAVQSPGTTVECGGSVNSAIQSTSM